MARKSTGWGYKIDYAKAIAEDLAEIAQVERHVALAAVLTDDERARGPYHVPLFVFLMTDPVSRAPLLGLTLEAAQELAWHWDYGQVPGLTEPPPGWFARASANEQRLEETFGSDVISSPQKLLAKLRARLARHRRNAQKNGFPESVTGPRNTPAV